jgi:hypothetical protein
MAGIDFSCNWRNTLIFNPNSKERVAYLPTFIGLGEALKSGQRIGLDNDITIWCPVTGLTTPRYSKTFIKEDKTNCVAIIESLRWAGGAGDPFEFACWISAQNAQMLMSAQKNTLPTTKMTRVSWWSAAFDTTLKGWFEENFPIDDKMAGMINSRDGVVCLHVESVGEKVDPSVDIIMHRMTFELVPAANEVAFINLSMSAQQHVVRNWGLMVGGNT